MGKKDLLVASVLREDHVRARSLRGWQLGQVRSVSHCEGEESKRLSPRRAYKYACRARLRQSALRTHSTVPHAQVSVDTAILPTSYGHSTSTHLTARRCICKASSIISCTPISQGRARVQPNPCCPSSNVQGLLSRGPEYEATFAEVSSLNLPPFQPTGTAQEPDSSEGHSVLHQLHGVPRGR